MRIECMTLLEAMSCGLPIIASDVGGIPELVEHEVNGLLFDPGNIRQLANAIDQMAGSQELRSCFSSSNRTKILGQFSWENIARQYELQCYSDVTLAAQQLPR